MCFFISWGDQFSQRMNQLYIRFLQHQDWLCTYLNTLTEKWSGDKLSWCVVQKTKPSCPRSSFYSVLEFWSSVLTFCLKDSGTRPFQCRSLKYRWECDKIDKIFRTCKVINEENIPNSESLWNKETQWYGYFFRFSCKDGKSFCWRIVVLWFWKDGIWKKIGA